MVRKMLAAVNYLVIVVVSLSVNGVLTQLNIDDPCTTNGTKGICKLISQCQSARDGLLKGILPTICGFEGLKSIVCCTDSTIVKVGDRAAEMCKQYAEYVYEESVSSSLSINPTNTKSLKCTFKKEFSDVTKASRQEFPHMAQLGYTNGSETVWACGGSLISKNFILTAAHCLSSPHLGALKLVRVGITNIADTNYLQVRNVQQIIKHPDYISSEKYHDIALLKIDENFDMNPYVRPACVYTLNTIPYARAIESSWGKTEFAGEPSEDLLKAVLDFFSTTQCNNTYRRNINQPHSQLANGIVGDLMICAGSSDKFGNLCNGGGSPLQVYHEETDDIKCMYNIVGVTSFGIVCGLVKNVPGVYTRVSAYVKWIEDNVWPR